MFYQRPDAYAAVMRSATAVNASFFNTQRMLAQYRSNAYFPEALTKPEELPACATPLPTPAELDSGLESAVAAAG